jgi:hypothetical protein
MIALVVVGTLVLLGGCLGVSWVGAHNAEVRLRNTLTAKQRDNASEFDNMWKTIAQVAEVTEANRAALHGIFVQHAEARSGGPNQGALMAWVQESVPNLDPASQPYRQLMNTITASRDRWTMRQKELLDLKREHDNVRTTFPSSLFVGGRAEIAVTIITSAKTEKTFEQGTDDDVNVFPKK